MPIATCVASSLLLIAGMSLGSPEAWAIGHGDDRQDHRGRIVGGKEDDGDPAVASLYIQNSTGGYICSGTVLGPHTFVTAGHCALPVSQALMDPGGFAVVVLGPNINTGPQYSVDVAQTYPGYTDINTIGDIGLVHTSAAMNVFDGGFGEYPPLNRIPLERVPLTGNIVRQIGYGETGPGANDPGIKREIEVTDVMVASATEIAESGMGGDTCEGDSGGPSLFQFPDGTWWEIAVTSKGSTLCDSSASDTRVDAYAQFITSFMETNDDSPSCGLDGRCATNCPAPDPDCPCALDGFCGIAAPNGTQCPDASQDPDCPQSCYWDGGSCAAPPPKPQPVVTPPKTGCSSVDDPLLWWLALAPLFAIRRRRNSF